MMQCSFNLKKLRFTYEEHEFPGFIAVVFLSGQTWKSKIEKETNDFTSCFNQFVAPNLAPTSDGSPGGDMSPGNLEVKQQFRLGDVCMIPN